MVDMEDMEAVRAMNKIRSMSVPTLSHNLITSAKKQDMRVQVELTEREDKTETQEVQEVESSGYQLLVLSNYLKTQ